MMKIRSLEENKKIKMAESAVKLVSEKKIPDYSPTNLVAESVHLVVNESQINNKNKEKVL